MNKTKIDWCDFSWNPVTGCLYGCEYCYARKISHRFRDKGFDEQYSPDCTHDIRIKGNGAYPYNFAPTFHRYKLNKPVEIKRPSKIFVCSMADLFGDWIPTEWIEAVFNTCKEASWHQYLFLTKNPQRYNNLIEEDKLPLADNFWYGGTRTGNDADREHKAAMMGRTFLSIEPVLGPILQETLNALDLWNWVIIGAETGNRKGKVTPEREWIETIADACRVAGVPLFMKGNLRVLMGDGFIQQYPDFASL